MSKRSKANKVSSKVKIPFADIQWLVNNLNAKDLANAESLEIGLSEIDNFMTQEIENGAQFSFKFDDYSDCPQASMFFGTEGYENSGYALSARGKSFVHCMTILMFKFHEICQGKLYELGQYSQDRPKYG